MPSPRSSIQVSSRFRRSDQATARATVEAQLLVRGGGIMDLRRFGIALGFASLFFGQSLLGQTPPVTRETWPRVVDDRGFHLVIYQPQVDSWKMNRLEAHAAVTASSEGSSSESFGIVKLSARTGVDKETRTVSIEDLKINSVSFPGAKTDQGELEKALRATLPDWPTTVSLDRLLADLSINGAEAQPQSAPLKADPPRIIFSQVPSVLVLIDGEPRTQPVGPSTHYTRVLNTPALILFDTSASRYYLDGNTLWMTAANLDGPWIQAINPPPDLNQIKAQILQTEEKDPHDHTKDTQSPVPTAPPSAVFVSATPAELIQTTGPPRFAPIPKTQLAYVTNTASDISRDAKTQDYYVLLAGRWYRASKPGKRSSPTRFLRPPPFSGTGPNSTSPMTALRGSSPSPAPPWNTPSTPRSK